MTDDEINPWATPNVIEPKRIVDGAIFNPVPCPQCSSQSIEPTPYSQLYGRRAPTAIEDVTCDDCQTNYNGVNGWIYPKRANPAVWIILSVIGFLMYMALVVLSAAL